MYKNCTIRPLIAEDLLMLLKWRNHPDIRCYMHTKHEIGLEEHYSWFYSVSKDCSRRLLIVEEHGVPIGFVQYSNLGTHGVANWGFYMSPERHKVGDGRKLGWAGLNYGFSVLGLHKVCGQVIETNVSSIIFHKKIGFKQEGVLREQQKIGDSYLSLICFGLLGKEWVLIGA